MWLYNNEEFSEIGEAIGFVYCITNLQTNRKYIGKKNFYFSKTRQVKGKKKRYKVDSDWKDYYGSNEELNHHVNIFGKDVFKREMTYFEAKYQFENSVLESDDYYNTWIMCKVRKSHLTFLKNSSKIVNMKGSSNGTSTQESPKKRSPEDRQSKKKIPSSKRQKKEVTHAHAGS